MSDQNIYVPKQRDKAIIECFREIMNLYGSAACNILVIGFNNSLSVDLKEKNDIISYLEKSDEFLIERATINIDGFSITFNRGGLSHEKSPLYDEVSFSSKNQDNLDQRLKLAVLVSKSLFAVHPSRTIGSLSPEQTQLEAIHTATLERLQSLNESLVEKTHKYREKLDQEFINKKAILDQDFSKTKSNLEEEYVNKERNLETQIEEKSKKLDQKSEELEKLRKELDDRDNTHVRREIRKDILKEIQSRQEKFSLTEGTNKLRTPIQYSMLGLITIFIVMGVVSGFEFYEVLRDSEYTKIIIAGIKQFIYSAGAVGSILYFIKWQNRWFEQHSASEFHLKQFALDMERASWLVESSLEWKDAKGTAIPAELLDDLSRNLFVKEGEKSESLEHPADQLASALFGSASSVKLKAGDSSMEIDPKKLKKTKIDDNNT